MKKMKPPMISSGSTAVSSSPSHEVSGAGFAVKTSSGARRAARLLRRGLHVGVDRRQHGRDDDRVGLLRGRRGLDGQGRSLLGDLLDLARLDLAEELGIAGRLVGWDVVVIHVNSSAAVPTTSTSITMPFRKNLGFNEGASGVKWATTERRHVSRV